LTIGNIPFDTGNCIFNSSAADFSCFIHPYVDLSRIVDIG
jgi:hypothetical protein